MWSHIAIAINYMCIPMYVYIVIIVIHICDWICETSLVRTKILIHFFEPAYSYVYSIAIHTPCLLWPDSSGLLF